MRVCILGGGPSLNMEDIKKVEEAGIDIIAINRSWELCTPEKITHHYCCDLKFWRHNWHLIHHDAPRHHLIYERMGAKPDGAHITSWPAGKRNGLEMRFPLLAVGGNSGYQAINMAYHLGYSEIILLGYDMGLSGDQTHWHGDHPGGLANPCEGTFIRWLRDFEFLAKDIREKTDLVIKNVSRRSALTCFERVDFDECISNLEIAK